MKDYRINYQLPASPLGPAVREQPKEECPFLSFERGDHKQRGAAWKDTHSNQTQRGPCADERAGSLAADIAAGCARPGSGGKQLEQVSSPAAPPFKVGDHVRVVNFGSAWRDQCGVITCDEPESPWRFTVDFGGDYCYFDAGDLAHEEKEEDPLLRAFKEDGIVREFRVGDRVRVVEFGGGGVVVGSLAVVECVWADGGGSIRMETGPKPGSVFGFCPQWLEHV